MWCKNLYFVGLIIVVLVTSSSADTKFPLGSYENYTKSPRIINGTLASVINTRHQVSIRRRLNDGYFFGTGHICGGSLIHSKVVLSAAHCFVDQFANNGSYNPTQDFIAVMGNLNRFEKNARTLICDIKKIIYGVEIFDPTTYERDIAVLILSDTVPAGHPTVTPIGLNLKPLASGTICQATGWGQTELGYLSDYLRTVDLPVIGFGTCVQESNYGALIKPGMLCAGFLEDGEQDACAGDSGGPLVCGSVLGGIISWGISCAVPRQPGVYTEVAFYVPWIERKLREENIVLQLGATFY